MPNLICGKSAVGGNYNSTRDNSFEDDADDELEEELEDAGLDMLDLEFMDEDERRSAIEDAGLDPDDYDDMF